MKNFGLKLFVTTFIFNSVAYAYELQPLDRKSPTIDIPIDSALEAKITEDLIFDNQNPDVTAITTKELIFNKKIILLKGSKLTGYAAVNDNQSVHFYFNTLVQPNGDEYKINATAKNSTGNDYVKAEYFVKKKKKAGIFGRMIRSATMGTISRSADGVAGDVAYDAADEVTDDMAENMRGPEGDSYSKLKKNTSIKIIVGR